ncbi:MAG: hypothetical protein EXS09_13725 [Gemmataceae bacterium]|nr:hypothetical protein [Gemmataceae bacterium]
MDVTADIGFRRSPFWAIALIALVFGQGWVTLKLFGPGLPIDRLTSDEMVFDGKHPLHAYHGLLANRVWHERQATTCYDPAFQAGYLKTPIFDAGSRPAELFYLLGGPTAGSYKIGLAICCLLAPLAFALAARGIGLGASGACFAAVIGVALWWSPACRALLEAGDIDLLAGGLFVPVYLAWLGRYWRSPGPTEFFVLAGSSAIAWYMHPLLMVGALPVALLFHLWAFRAVRFAWHLGLFFANLAGLAVNSFWIWDWGCHVRMYVPYGGEEAPHTLWPAAMAEWQAFLPNDPIDLAVAILGLIGLLCMARKNSVGAVLLAVGTMLFVVAGGAGQLWPAIAEVGAQKTLSIGIWCCAIPAAYALTSIAGSLGSSAGFRALGLVWIVIGIGGLCYGLDLSKRFEIAPLEIGLGSEREETIRAIRTGTSPDGRILWEDRSDGSRASGWSAMLPELTQRAYLGGLSPEIAIDHMHARLADGKLLGRAVADWTDDELARFFARYNVTRVICRTPESEARFRRLKGASSIAGFPKGSGTMFAIDRRPDFVLKGKASVTQMDWKRVALSELVPDENGSVVLSLHHHANWDVTPGYIEIEKDVDASDPIPMIRLRLTGPADRVTLTWKGH